MEKDFEKINPEILKQAEEKIGMNPEEIKKAINSGNLKNIMKKLDKTDAQKIEKVLSNKESAMKFLSNSKVQTLLKKFLGGK